MNLKIINFKCYEELEINFKRFNLITGKNSSGKSTILDALLLFFVNTDGEINLKDIYEKNFIGFSQLLNRNDKNRGDFEISLNDVVKIFDEFITEGGFSKNSSAMVKKSTLSNIDKLNMRFRSISSDRTIDFNQIESHSSRSYIPTRNNKSLLSFMYLLENTGNYNIIEKCSEVLRDIGLIQEGITVSIHGDSYKLHVDGIDLNHVGVGIKYVLPIIVTLLTNNKTIISIENPEIHLHPSAQVKLVDVMYELSFKNENLLLIETHSDHVLNATRSNIKRSKDNYNNSLILFADENHQLHNIQFDDNGKLLVDHPYFFDEIEKQLIGLF